MPIAKKVLMARLRAERKTQGLVVLTAYLTPEERILALKYIESLKAGRS